MLPVDQVEGVGGVFALVGYEEELRTHPVTSVDERIFVIPQQDFVTLRDVRQSEQVLQQILVRKVWFSRRSMKKPFHWAERPPGVLLELVA